MIASGCFGAGNHPPQKKKAPGGLQASQNDGRFETKCFRILPEKISYSFREKHHSYLIRRGFFLLLLPEQRAPGITSDQGTGCASCRFPKQNLSHCLKQAVAVVICWIFLGKLPGIFVADPWDPIVKFEVSQFWSHKNTPYF